MRVHTRHRLYPPKLQKHRPSRPEHHSGKLWSKLAHLQALFRCLCGIKMLLSSSFLQMKKLQHRKSGVQGHQVSKHHGYQTQLPQAMQQRQEWQQKRQHLSRTHHVLSTVLCTVHMSTHSPFTATPWGREAGLPLGHQAPLSPPCPPYVPASCSTD